MVFGRRILAIDEGLFLSAQCSCCDDTHLHRLELRGFEPLTSAVRAPTRFTAPPLPTHDPESTKFVLKSLAGDDLNSQLDRKARDAASVNRTRAPSRQVKAG
jgi:hypothetical protein